MQISQRQRPITPERAGDVRHEDITSGWDNAAYRVKPSRGRIVVCNAMRRGIMTVTIPSTWLTTNGIGSGWLEAAVPERWMIDLSMTNILGEQGIEYTRTPLGTTDTAQADADNLEIWVGSAERDKRGGTDYDAMTGLAVQHGEWASLVLPTRADMRRPLQYREDIKASNGTVVRMPKKLYDRDERGKPSDAAGYNGRSERQSRRAYDDAYQSWMARNHPWTTRLVSATDCAPVMTRGLGRSRWECTGLFVRTLYDHESLIDAGWEWDGMNKAGEMIPREHGTDSNVGDGGQIYVYEGFLRTKDGRPFLAYTVGGMETWWADGDKTKATIIDFTDEYDVPEGELLWDYHYGLHFEDDPAYRGVPLLWPLVPTLLNLESLRTAVNAATWATSFTGHTQRPDPNVPPTAYLDGHGQFKPWTPPLPGQVKPSYGEIAPFQQAKVGEDAWRAMAEQRAQLQSATPDPAQQGGAAGTGRSGHSLVVGQDLLQMGKRQIKQGILDCGTSIVYRKLLIAGTFLKRDKPIEWPVFVRREEVLPTGEAKRRTEVLPLKERWVGDNYWMDAEYPKEGNLADIKLAQELAMTGFATDEDVFEARGKKSTIIERAKVANYQWLKSPEGQIEAQMRAAQYRGDVEKMKLLEMVRAQKMSPGGTPTAAFEEPTPPTGAPGQTAMPSPADAALNGMYQGAVGMASESRDSRGQAALANAGSGQVAAGGSY